MSFSLLFKFETDKERNDMVIELHELLTDWGKDSYWNEWHAYMSFLLQRHQKKKRVKWMVDGDPRLLKPSTPFKLMNFLLFYIYESLSVLHAFKSPF